MRVDIRIYAMTAAPGPAMKMAFPEERKRPLTSDQIRTHRTSCD
jgi:hypothetical protein